MTAGGSDAFGFGLLKSGRFYTGYSFIEFGTTGWLFASDAGLDVFTAEIGGNRGFTSATPSTNWITSRFIVDSGNVPDNFVRTGKFTDPRDGKVYKTVLMPGGKWWAAENLAWPGSGWDYNNDPANRAVYGRLYTWDEANSSCPSGTHLPTDAEWTAMEAACGTPATLGIRLRANSVLWTNPAARGTDNYGFGILPAGRRTWASTFSQLGSFANLWSATVASSGRSWDRETWDGTSTVTRYSEEQIVGESVRFIVDSGNVPDSPAWTLGSNSADILVVNE